MHLTSTLKRIRIILVGSDSVFSLEARIYHSICIVAFFALAYNVPFNYFVGLPRVAFVSLIALAGFAWLYYMSRVRKEFIYSVIGLGILGNIFFAVVYFLNSGIDGPTLILFALFFYLLSSTAPRNQQWIWLMVNVSFVLGISVTQYYFPSLVPSSYPTLASRFTDTVSAYIVVILSLFFSLKYIRQNYEIEKKSALNRALDIELKNIQLELLNGEKNKLFSIVAHDLRSPLASIQSYLELLTAYPLKEEEKKEIELKLLSLTKNTSNMMANLLSWSKSQLEGVRVNIQPLDLLKTLRDMLKVETSIAHEKNISLTYHISENIYIEADANMLLLVVRNLISNAIKFTPSGGNIQVMAAVENDCKISIVDSGTGINENDQKYVFSLKAKSTFGTNNEKGVGLGLILCKEFTELQNGSISFVSTPGKGTSFIVSIPLFNKHITASSQQGELNDRI
jgi:two-component system sensor histidine kinase/response regulator